MTQPQVQQPNRPKVPSRNYAYTMNRMYNGDEWMLSKAKPRTWTKKPVNALLFTSPEEVDHYISLLFQPDERDDIYAGRIRIGN